MFCWTTALITEDTSFPVLSLLQNKSQPAFLNRRGFYSITYEGVDWICASLKLLKKGLNKKSYCRLDSIIFLTSGRGLDGSDGDSCSRTTMRFTFMVLTEMSQWLFDELPWKLMHTFMFFLEGFTILHADGSRHPSCCCQGGKSSSQTIWRTLVIISPYLCFTTDGFFILLSKTATFSPSPHCFPGA